MRILFLGPMNPPQLKIISYLNENQFEVQQTENNLDTIKISFSEIDFLISFGYRYIIKDKVLNHFKERAINLHISLLPWNKGADPTFWSVFENTPKGISIHIINTKLDTGPILCQKKISIDKNSTFRNVYDKLHNEIVNLFINNWVSIRNKDLEPQIQSGKGSYHKSSDKNKYLGLLTDGWDTKINKIINRTKNV